MIFIVGDVDSSLHSFAKWYSYDPIFIGMLDENTTTDAVIYGSLGDTNVNDFLQLLCKAKKIIYQSPLEWSDNRLKDLTEFLLFVVAQIDDGKELIGFDKFTYRNQKHINLSFSVDDIGCLPQTLRSVLPWSNINFLGIQDYRVSNDPQLWVAGCSYPNGDGLDDKNTRYGQLVADTLDLPVSFLTTSGSGIDWAANQIINADIQKNDVVLWAITGIPRKTLIRNQQAFFGHPTLLMNNITEISKNDLLFFDQMLYDDTMLLDAMCDINKVINFCKKIQVNLILISHPELSSTKQYSILNEYLKKIPNFLDMHDGHWEEFVSKNQNDLCYKEFRKFLYHDIGSDDVHPGPLTHRMYAEKIVNFINNKKLSTNY